MNSLSVDVPSICTRLLQEKGKTLGNLTQIASKRVSQTPPRQQTPDVQNPRFVLNYSLHSSGDQSTINTEECHILYLQRPQRLSKMTDFPMLPHWVKMEVVRARRIAKSPS